MDREQKLSSRNENFTDRCARCVLPKSLTQIQFSEDGICAPCLHRKAEQTQAAPETTEDVAQTMERVRTLGKGRPFDCLVGLSGGRDSTYLTYLLTQKHGLRVLAAYYRTPFTHDVIDQNVKRIVRQLQVPLVEMDISREQHVATARRFFAYWRKYPSLELANLACVSCKLVNREVHRIARAHRIRCIVFGGNKNELVQFVPTFQSGEGSAARSSFRQQTRKLYRIGRKGVHVIRTCPALLTSLPLCAKAALLYVDFGTSYLRLRYPEMQRIDYFHNVPLDETQATGVVTATLGWQRPPDCYTTWRADCDFAELKNYMFEQVCGATYTDGYFSNLIRAGQMTRAEALSQLHEGSYLSWNRIRRVLRTLGLPEDTIPMGS